MPENLWHRTHRVSAYDAPRRARYPTVARTEDGTLILLFTRVSEEQEQASLGDLMIIRSFDLGESWSIPVSIYQGEKGEPRTRASMRSGT